MGLTKTTKHHYKHIKDSFWGKNFQALVRLSLTKTPVHYNLSCATFQAKSEWMFHFYLHLSEISLHIFKIKAIKKQFINKFELLSVKLGISFLVFNFFFFFFLGSIFLVVFFQWKDLFRFKLLLRQYRKTKYRKGSIRF